MDENTRLRGPKTKKDIVNEILLLKKIDQTGKLSAADIRKKLVKTHKENFVPKERAIYNIIKKNKDKVTFNPIDAPWSIGSCEKYHIPAEIIPTLIEREQLGLLKFTNRQAYWYAKLKPVVFEMSTAGRPLEDCLAGLALLATKDLTKLGIPPVPHNDARLALLEIITYQYAGDEQFSELQGNEYLDTSDLDFTIFIEGKIGPEERGEPIRSSVWDPTLAFNSRFQTNMMIISPRKEKNKRLNNQEK